MSNQTKYLSVITPILLTLAGLALIYIAAFSDITFIRYLFGIVGICVIVMVFMLENIKYHERKNRKTIKKRLNRKG